MYVDKNKDKLNEKKRIDRRLKNDMFDVIKKCIDYTGSSLDLQNKLEKLKDEYEKDMLIKEMKIQELEFKLEHTIKYKELELKCKDMEIELLRNKLQ